MQPRDEVAARIRDLTVECGRCGREAWVGGKIGDRCGSVCSGTFVKKSPAPVAATERLPWRCRCTEPAPDRIGVVRVRRPADESRCLRCGSTQAEYEAEMEEGFDPWGA